MPLNKRPVSARSTRPVLQETPRAPKGPTRPITPLIPQTPPAAASGSNKTRFFAFFEGPRQAAVVTPRARPTSARTIVAATNARGPRSPVLDKYVDPVASKASATWRRETPLPAPPPVRTPVLPASPPRPALSVATPEPVLDRVLWGLRQHDNECKQAIVEQQKRAELRRTPTTLRGRPKSAPPVLEGCQVDTNEVSPQKNRTIYTHRLTQAGVANSSASPAGVRPRPPSLSTFQLPRQLRKSLSPGRKSAFSPSKTIKEPLPGSFKSSPKNRQSRSRPHTAYLDEMKEAARTKRYQESIKRILSDGTKASNPLAALAKSSSTNTPTSRSSMYSSRAADIFSGKGASPGMGSTKRLRRGAIEAKLSTKMKLGHEKADPMDTVGETIEFQVNSASNEGASNTEAASNLATSIEGQPFGWQAPGDTKQWVILDTQVPLSINGLKIKLPGGEMNPRNCAVQFALTPEDSNWTTAVEFELGYTDETFARKIEYDRLMQVSRFKTMLIKRYGSINRAWRRILDTSGDGVLQYEEFIQACKEVGYKPPQGVTLESLYMELDDNGDGAIRATDLCNAKTTLPKSRYWRLLFGEAHGKYHGTEEKQMKICSLQVYSKDILPVPRKEARAKALRNHLSEAMTQKVNAFGDDVLVSETDREMRNLAKAYGLQVVEVEKVKKQFDNFDPDSSGSISFDEFKNLMMKLLDSKDASDVPPARIEFFWHMVDLDQSGSVEFEEFLNWQNSYFGVSNDRGHDPVKDLPARFYSHAQDCRVKQARAWLQDNPLRNRLGGFAERLLMEGWEEYEDTGTPSEESSS